MKGRENMLIRIYIPTKTEERIPYLNRPGPVGPIAVGTMLYNNLRRVPGIEVYTELEWLQKLEQERRQSQLAKQTKDAASAAPVSEEVDYREEVVIKEIATEPEVNETLKPVEKEIDDIDAAIDAQIESLPVDEVPITTGPDLIKKYTKKELTLMTKKEMKHILNVERGFEPGHKWYGGYHDRHAELITFILESQE